MNLKSLPQILIQKKLLCLGKNLKGKHSMKCNSSKCQSISGGQKLIRKAQICEIDEISGITLNKQA